MFNFLKKFALGVHKLLFHVLLTYCCRLVSLCWLQYNSCHSVCILNFVSCYIQSKECYFKKNKKRFEIDEIWVEPDFFSDIPLSAIFLSQSSLSVNRLISMFKVGNEARTHYKAHIPYLQGACMYSICTAYAFWTHTM